MPVLHGCACSALKGSRVCLSFKKKEVGNEMRPFPCSAKWRLMVPKAKEDKAEGGGQHWEAESHAVRNCHCYL